MTEPLLEKVLDAHGGLGLWSGLTKITAHLSIGGPIWAAKGWADALVKETVEIETKTERIVFSPFTKPGLRSVFEVGPERVTIESADGGVVERRLDARRAFKGFIRYTPWDILHLGYFVGYGIWNYLTAPFLFTYPGVEAREIDPRGRGGADVAPLARHVPRFDRDTQPAAGVLLRCRRPAAPHGLRHRDPRQHVSRALHRTAPLIRRPGCADLAARLPAQPRRHREPEHALDHDRHRGRRPGVGPCQLNCEP